MQVRRIIRRPFTVILAAALGAITLVAAPAAQASSTTLCTGSISCLLAGRSDAGYGLLSFISYWNQTPGHNCTNYAAYRLSHGGRLVARPPGTGGAATWGVAARAAGVPVNDSPTVGAIAWWPASASSPSGHVAYVEQVMSDGSVLVSEDNLNGDFRWRHMTRGTGWPSGFIHYPRSNGSPSGVFTSVSAAVAGQIDFWGTSSDPDGGSLLSPSYLVTLGGPRGAAGIESFTFSTAYFTFHRIKAVATRGSTTMYLYALNTPLTAGSDVLLGSRPVTIRSTSRTTASFVDPTITAATTPRMRVTLAPTAGYGRVDITRGSTVLRSIVFEPGGVRTFTLNLPRQARGTHTIYARYRGSTRHLPSHARVSLAVR
ncbi:CHAP domain-containing protein [Aeromicrobium sp.]|uniref:CHAP domain-containing protein n=1 Tax=Aeromicrobium sp. TaxID=1871063 RepID=UPI002FCCB5EC